MSQQTEKQPQTNPEKKEKRSLLMKVGRVAAAIAIAATAVAGEYYANDPLLATKTVVEAVVKPGGERVSAKTLKTVNYHLDHPDNEGLVAIDSNNCNGEISFEEWEEKYNQYRFKKAAEAGLELFDAEPYQEELKKAKTIDDVTEITDRFVKNTVFNSR